MRCGLWPWGPVGQCGAMLLDGSKGHKGLHRFESGSAARDTVKREAQSHASGNIGEFRDWLVTLPKGPDCSHDYSGGFV